MSTHPQLKHSLLSAYWQSLLPLLKEPETQEILINPDGRVWIDRCGELINTEQQLSDDYRIGIIRLLSDTPQSYISTHYAGLRIAAALPPLSVLGPYLCIRKKTYKPTHEQQLLCGPRCDVSIPKDTSPPSTLSDVLQYIVTHRQASLIIGGTSTGKTTLIQWLMSHCPHERVFLVEDTPEITVDPQAHTLSFCCSTEEWPVLLPFLLRCRPDRLIVGEIRGREAWSLIDIYLSGHASGWTSLHAEDTHSALIRLRHLMHSHPATSSINTHDLAQKIAHTFRYLILCQRIGQWRGPVRIDRLEGYDPQTGFQLSTLFSHI